MKALSEGQIVLKALISSGCNKFKTLHLHGDNPETDKFHDEVSKIFPKGTSNKSADRKLKRILNKLWEERLVGKQLETRSGWDGYGYCAPPTRQNGYWITWRGEKLIKKLKDNPHE